MLQVGITGGIGAGKSTVCKIFECLQIPVLNTDALAKNLYNSDYELQSKMIASFGEFIFEKNKIDTKKLASIVFSNKEKIELLNSIVHPFVFEAIEVWQKKQTSAYTIRESALLIETGSYKILNAIIGVTSPLENRLANIQQRDNCSIEQAKARIDKQLPEAERQKYYNYTVINNESQFLIPQVLDIHRQLLITSKK